VQTCALPIFFDVWLIARRPHASRVQDQTARLAVLAKRPRWSRVEGIGPSYGGREVVHDQTDRETLKESPCLFEAFDGGFHRLLDQRPEKAVAAVDQHHQ